MIIALAILLSITFTGCTGYTDINNSNIFTTVFAHRDIFDYNIGGFVAKIKSKGLSAEAGGATEIELIQGSDSTLNGAFSNMDRQNANTGFFGAVQAVVMTDSFVRDDISPYIIRLKQMLNSRLTVPIFTTNVDPDKLIKAKATNNLTVGFEMDGLRKTLLRDGRIINVYLSNILQSQSSGYNGFLIPSVTLSDDEIVTFNGYSVFSENKKVGHIDYDKCLGLSYLLSPNTIETHSVKSNNNEFLVYTKKQSCSIKPYIKNNRLLVDINVKVKGKGVSDTNYASDLPNEELQTIQNEIDNQIKQKLYTSVTQLKLYKTDYIGITKRLRARYGEDITYNYVNELLRDAIFKVTVDSTIV